MPPAVVDYLNAVAAAVREPIRAHVAWIASLKHGWYFPLPDHRVPHPGVTVADQLLEGVATRQTPTLTVRQAQARLLRWAYHRLGAHLADERRRAEAPGDLLGTRLVWERLVGEVPTEGERWLMTKAPIGRERLHQAGGRWAEYWRRGGTRDAATLAALRFGAAELALLAAGDAPGTADGDEHEGDT